MDPPLHDQLAPQHRILPAHIHSASVASTPMGPAKPRLRPRRPWREDCRRSAPWLACGADWTHSNLDTPHRRLAYFASLAGTVARPPAVGGTPDDGFCNGPSFVNPFRATYLCILRPFSFLVRLARRFLVPACNFILRGAELRSTMAVRPPAQPAHSVVEGGSAPRHPGGGRATSDVPCYLQEMREPHPIAGFSLLSGVGAWPPPYGV